MRDVCIWFSNEKWHLGALRRHSRGASEHHRAEAKPSENWTTTTQTREKLEEQKGPLCK